MSAEYAASTAEVSTGRRAARASGRSHTRRHSDLVALQRHAVAFDLRAVLTALPVDLDGRSG